MAKKAIQARRESEPWDLEQYPTWHETSPVSVAPLRKRGRPGPTADQVDTLKGETAAFTKSVNDFVATENERRRLCVPRVRKITYADLSVELLGGSARAQPWSDLTNGREYLTPGRLINVARNARQKLGWNDPAFAYLTAVGVEESRCMEAIYDDDVRLEIDRDVSEAQFKVLADWLIERHDVTPDELRAALEMAIWDNSRRQQDRRDEAGR